MKQVTIYTLNYCPFCKKAKKILRENNIPFNEIDITAEEETQTPIVAKKLEINGEITFPQIIIGEKRIGGCSDLEQLVTNGELDNLLKEE